MAEPPNIYDPPDICLLLRAHCEQRWLISEVVPVLRQVEQPGAIPEDQFAAALAYLETLWLDARRRAADTDAARVRLDAHTGRSDAILYAKARRYHAAVRRLRQAVAHRVTRATRGCWPQPPTLAHCSRRAGR
jgi:hypothetical protein